MTTEEFEDCLNQAIGTLLWSEVDEDDTPLDYDYDRFDVAPESVESLRDELLSFVELNADDLADLEPSQVGHDFILTRNHHGAGFWDRGLGALGDRLTDSAHPYGSISAYVGDDGRVYFE